MTGLLRPSRVALAAASVVAAASAVLPGPATAGVVQGYVLDGLRDERLPGVEVAFLVPDGGGGVTEIARRTTDDSGAFSFAGPFLAEGTTFALTAYYGGLEYGTRKLVVGDQDQVIVEVNEGTEDPSGIRITAHHLFLSVTDRGLEVLQLVEVENQGPATYMGRLVDEERRVLELAVPAGHLGLQAHAGEIVRAGPTRVFDTRPLPPGSTRTAFTFQLSAEALAGGYEHTVLHPTDRLELFLQPPELALGPPFRDLGRITLQDQEYRHYRLEDLVPGRTAAVPLPVPMTPALGPEVGHAGPRAGRPDRRPRPGPCPGLRRRTDRGGTDAPGAAPPGVAGRALPARPRDPGAGRARHDGPAAAVDTGRGGGRVPAARPRPVGPALDAAARG